jgi:translation elongation factor EF-Ts
LLESLAICELWEAIVDDFINEFVDQHEVCPQEFFVDSSTEVVDSVDDVVEELECQRWAQVSILT